MGETFIVPEGAVLQNEPSSGFTNSAPSLALISMAANPTRSVEIPIKAKFLFVRHKIGIAGVHIFRRRLNLFVMERGVQVR
jgi:hypothetical protein